MDWVAELPAGRSKVKVHFAGGALTQYGVTPAEYTTDNIFFQKVIEGSAYYRDGRIKLLRSVQAEERQGGAAAAAAGAGAPGTAAAESAEQAAEAAEAERELAEVETTCLQDAQSYLAEHYGIAASKARTWAAAQAAGAEHGVRFLQP